MATIAHTTYPRDTMLLRSKPIPFSWNARERDFARRLRPQRLVIEQVGIGDQPGRAPFWINDERDVFSSFDAARAGRNGMKCHAIDVQCVTFDTILHKYGGRTISRSISKAQNLVA